MTDTVPNLRYHGVPGGLVGDLVVELVGPSFSSSTAFLDGRKGKKIIGRDQSCVVAQTDVGKWLVAWTDESGEHRAEFRVRMEWERVS